MRRFINEKDSIIEYLDERFYQSIDIDGNEFYVPSVTHILDVAYSKGYAYEQWLKDVGNNAKIIGDRAKESGSKVHNACYELLSGALLNNESEIYTLEEWKGIIGFTEFMTFVDKVYGFEKNLIGNLWGGTLDLACSINEEDYIIDYKFGNAVYDNYYLQLIAYKILADEFYKKDFKIAILWLKANTRGERKGLIQGQGWQIKYPDDDYEILKKVWKSVLEIYKFKNPISKPSNLIYPMKLQLNLEGRNDTNVSS